MTEDQTLVAESGHPLGLFQRNQSSSVVITSTVSWIRRQHARLRLLKKWASYQPRSDDGQADEVILKDRSWYLQHSLMPWTSKLGVPDDGDLTGKLAHLVSVGWGGSREQLKSQKRWLSLQKWTALIETRHSQGWIRPSDRQCWRSCESGSSSTGSWWTHFDCYHGNIRLARICHRTPSPCSSLVWPNLWPQRLRDSCRPVGISFEERIRLLAEDKRKPSAAWLMKNGSSLAVISFDS